jgi:multidrug resistance efflux pump
MMVIIIGLYAGIIWLLFFKLKLVEPNAKSYTAAAIIGVVIVGAILLAANLFQPYSKSAVVSQYVVQVAPRVSGMVTRIDARPNVPVKKGDILFELDPRPFQATVDGLKAALVQAEQNAKMLEANLDSAQANVANTRAALVNSHQRVKQFQAALAAATANVAQVTAERDLAQLNYDRVVAAKEEDPGAIADATVDARRQSLIGLEDSLAKAIANEAEARVAVEAVLDGENTLVLQAQAQLDSAEAAESKARLALESVIDGENTAVVETRAQLRNAELNLSFTKIYAPTDGFVTNLQLREGFTVGARAPVMTLIDSSERYLVAPLGQNVVRHVEEGDDVEVALVLYPGKILEGTVDSIIWASREGQGDPSGALPQADAVTGGTALAVRVSFPDLSPDLELPVGAGGRAAIYTAKGKPLRVIRKITLRMYSWLNYF